MNTGINLQISCCSHIPTNTIKLIAEIDNTGGNLHVLTHTINGKRNDINYTSKVLSARTFYLFITFDIEYMQHGFSYQTVLLVIYRVVQNSSWCGNFVKFAFSRFVRVHGLLSCILLLFTKISASWWHMQFAKLW